MSNLPPEQMTAKAIDYTALLAENVELRAALEAARGERPSGFMSQREWEDWSNELAMALPEDCEGWPGVNPEGAQESIIEAALSHLVTESQRLRDGITALAMDLARGDSIDKGIAVQLDALLLPTERPTP